MTTTKDDLVTDATTAPRRDITAWIGLVLRLIVGAVMLWAGITKAMNLSETQMATRAFQILPYELAGAWGLVMPFVEILVGALLVVGLFVRPAAIVAGLLMVAFIIGIISVWVRGISIDCGCFGGGGTTKEPAYPMELARDIALFACCAWLILKPRTKFDLDSKLWG
ncbi:DoxX family protein [Calidifontibacter sp. DB0510]|uniref:DoxX family protein n=1 Tax=Metallococcus carri TaxID=1656884 RepID=A0A967AYR9_9MICO|nr:DoxX family protein [Metallococcus carri]NHN54290.1 DoxX family protein [Metallococcus carri]NOP36870.1 DoxX family protein [Calidifontibacter sp. DB2511S]